jgi:uncharacterized membrane protein YdjX (TVP38/TMEM64 family)
MMPPPDSTQQPPPTLSRQEVIRQAGPAGVLAIAWTVLPAILGITMLVQLGPISEWLHDQGTAGIAIYIGTFAITAGFGVLPTYAQAILGGWVFGIGVGLVAALVGFTAAAAIGYGLARLVSGDRIQQLLLKHQKAKIIQQALIGRSSLRTFGIVTLIRIPPNSPFALTNLLIAACGVPLGLSLIGTAVGMLPRTAVAVAFASAAHDTGASDIQTFVKDGMGIWVLVGGIVTMLIVLIVIGSIGKRALDHLTTD